MRMSLRLFSSLRADLPHFQQFRIKFRRGCLMTGSPKDFIYHSVPGKTEPVLRHKQGRLSGRKWVVQPELQLSGCSASFAC